MPTDAELAEIARKILDAEGMYANLREIKPPPPYPDAKDLSAPPNPSMLTLDGYVELSPEDVQIVSQLWEEAYG
jgi:hypothetical protein